MGWPQLIYIALTCMSVGVHLANDGEPRTPYSAGHSIAGAVISFALLYWGGFFGAHL